MVDAEGACWCEIGDAWIVVEDILCDEESKSRTGFFTRVKDLGQRVVAPQGVVG